MSFLNDLVGTIGKNLGVSEFFGGSPTIANPVQKVLVDEAARIATGTPKKVSTPYPTSPSPEPSPEPSPQPPAGNVGQPAAPVGPSRAQLDPLYASLESLGDIRTNRNATTNAEFGRAIEGYDASDAADRASFDQNTQQNERSLTGGNQAALLNAANASTGLRGVLASLGGLSGSGMDVVSRLVGLAANQDTGAARKNFDVNAEGLNQSFSMAEREQRQRRGDAEATRDNNLANNEADVLNSRKSIFESLAKAFGAGTAKGGEYASKAGALAAPIAATTRGSVAPYAKASSTFSPAALKSYLGGTQNLEVNTSGGGSSTPINSAIFSRDQDRDRLSGVA